MSKNKKRAAPSKPRAGRVARRRRAGKAKAAAVVALAVCVTAGAATAGLRWGPARRAFGLAPAEPLAQATPTPLQLSKEYVYAGGRLVATEEPSPAPAGPAPTGLVATVSPTVANQIDLTWVAPTSGTVDHYEIGRKGRVSDQLSVVGSTQGAVTNFSDAGSPDTAYLYAVRAVFAGGGRSDYSNTDLATTVVFTDDPLQVGVTKVKAVHLTELHRAVDAVRVLAGLGAASWQSNPSPASGGSILAAHFLELRANLNPALSALGMSQLPTDSTLAVGLIVKKAHIQDVREKVK